MHAHRLCHVHYIQKKNETAPACSELDCEKPSRSRGMCTMHYDRQLRLEAQEEIDYDDFWKFVKKERRIGEPNAKRI
jgi:hypothetical protein